MSWSISWRATADLFPAIISIRHFESETHITSLMPEETAREWPAFNANASAAKAQAIQRRVSVSWNRSVPPESVQIQIKSPPHVELFQAASEYKKFTFAGTWERSGSEAWQSLDETDHCLRGGRETCHPFAALIAFRKISLKLSHFSLNSLNVKMNFCLVC